MKHFYIIVCLLVFSFSFGQTTPKKGEIVGFKLYPNPVTNNKVFIQTKDNAPKKIIIYDVLGTPVLKTTIIGKELNLREFDSGVYVLRVFEKDKVATRKLIVK